LNDLNKTTDIEASIKYCLCILLLLHLYNNILCSLMCNCFYDTRHNGILVTYPGNWYSLTVAHGGLKLVEGKL